MKHQAAKQNVPHSSLHVWMMTFICILFVVLAAAAATRLPSYLATGDVVRLVGTIAFDLLALVGLTDNLHTHYLVWQQQNQAKAAQLAAQN